MCSQSAADRVRSRVSNVAELYHRLVLVVGSSGSGKTQTLLSVAEPDAPVLSLGIDISLRLLDLTERQRVVQLPRIFSEVVQAIPGRRVSTTLRHPAWEFSEFLARPLTLPAC